MTRMKTGAYISIILMALLVSGIVHIALAQDIVAGVKPGEVFTYSVTGSYSDNAPIGSVPEEVLAAQATEFFQVKIVNVSGVEVWYDWSWHFNNGSAPLSNSSMVNIETTENTGPFSTIVSANLTTGERIHPHFGPPSTFNETVMWTYENYTRETNRWETLSAQQSNVTAVTRYRTVHSDSYFDKQTGMLVQFTEDTSYQDPAFTTTLTWKLIQQSAWTSNSPGSYPPPPFFTLPVIIAIGVVVAIVGVIAGWFVSNKRRDVRRRKLLRKR